MFGKRILFVRCDDAHSDRICEIFLNVIFRFEKEINRLMDKLKIPEQIMLNFKKGKGNLEGLYRVQGKRTAEYIIPIDVYTRTLKIPEDERELEIFEENILDTFIHELIHHQYKSENATSRYARRFTLRLLKEV